MSHEAWVHIWLTERRCGVRLVHVPAFTEVPSSLPERSLVNSSWASIDLNDGGQSARNIAGASSPSYKTSRGEGILSTPLSFTPHEAGQSPSIHDG